MGIAVFQISCSSLIDTLSTMMIKVVLVVAILLTGAEAGCSWGYKARCSEELHCSFGCHKGYCWSQCNAICSNDGTNEYGKLCGECKEWCYLKGASSKYQTCSVDGDCFEVRNNSCSGGCTV